MNLKIYTAILCLDYKLHLFYLALQLPDFSTLLASDAVSLVLSPAHSDGDRSCGQAQVSAGTAGQAQEAEKINLTFIWGFTH